MPSPDEAADERLNMMLDACADEDQRALLGRECAEDRESDREEDAP